MNCIKCLSGNPGRLKILSTLRAEQSSGYQHLPANTDAQAKYSCTAGCRLLRRIQQHSRMPLLSQDNGCTARNQNTQYQDPYAQYQNTQYQTPPVYQSSYEPEKPINWVPYLVLSIITTVLLPVFRSVFVGIVYATKDQQRNERRETIKRAQKSAKTAKIWIIVAAAVGVIANIIVAVMAAMGAMDSYYYYY